MKVSIPQTQEQGVDVFIPGNGNSNSRSSLWWTKCSIYKLRSGVRLPGLIFFYVLLEIWTRGSFRIFTLCCLKVQNAWCRFITFYQHIYRFKDAKKNFDWLKKETNRINEVQYLPSHFQNLFFQNVRSSILLVTFWDPLVCGILNWMDKSSIFLVLTFLLIIAEARAFKMSTEHRGEFSINFNINWIEIQYLGTCWMPRRGISLYWNIQYSRACSKQSLSTTLFDDSYLIVNVCPVSASYIMMMIWW